MATELAKAYVQIIPSADGIKGSITTALGGEATNAGKSAGKDYSSSFGDALKSGLASAAKIGLAAVSAGIAGITALSKSAIESYAEYEQLVGGVETLFGDSADKVVEYASNAFKTAGLSANDYMETVTSFSASLLQSLGNDTDAAAEKANLALTDMSDNANKMGTDMESIQNAYQGFAKQNYTMLDNLKLGYGGTQSEMERLLADAQAISGVEYDISSYADIVDAIHVIQTEMGITGTTAEEASTTIQGSISSMSAAWTNFLTGMADENQDFDTLLGNLVDSVVTVGENLIPRIQTLLPRLTEGIAQLVNSLIGYIPDTLNTLLPTLIDAATGLVDSVVDILPSVLTTAIDALPQLAEAAVSIVGNLFDALTVAIPELASAGLNMILSLVDGVIDALPNLLSSAQDILPKFISGITSGLSTLSTAAVSIMTSLGSFLQENLPTILETGLNALVELTSSLRENAGVLVDGALAMIQSIATGLIHSLPTLIETVPEIVSNIANIINDNAPKLLETARNLIVQLGQGLINAIPTLVANIPKIITAITDVFTAFNWINLGKNIMTLLKNGITGMVSSLKSAGTNVLNSIYDAIKSLPSKLLNLGKSAGSFLSSGLKGMLSTVKSAAASILNGVVSSITNLPSKLLTIGKNAVTKMKSVFKISEWKNIGKNVINGIISGITSMVSSLYNSIKSALSGLVDKAKKALGIASPSRLFRDEIGAMIPEGLALGIELNTDQVESAMDDMVSTVEDSAGVNTTVNSVVAAAEAQNASVTSAVSAGTSDPAALLEELNANFDLFFGLLPELFTQLANAQVVMDTGKEVGALVVPMDKALGQLKARKARQS